MNKINTIQYYVLSMSRIVSAYRVLERLLMRLVTGTPQSEIVVTPSTLMVDA